MIEISTISAKETVPVRHPVLREGMPVESCFFEGDDLETTVHFGCFLNKELVGVITLLRAKSNLFSEECQAQLRGMAVLKEHQKRGLGKELFNECILYCSANKIPLAWFNARVTAIDFYKKQGCVAIGSVFEIQDAGDHSVMYKYTNA